jgi:hypothetical protein
MNGLRTILGLAARSLWNRRGTALLTIFSIAVSVTLLLGVERVRTEAGPASPRSPARTSSSVRAVAT